MPRKKADQTPSFARAPMAHELLTDEGKKNFNALASWQRHLIRRLIDHGDLSRAAQETGVARYVSTEVDEKRVGQVSVVEALNKGGLTADVLVVHLMDCLEAKMVVRDKHGNAYPTVNKALKLKALELIFHLRGDLSKKHGVEAKVEDLFQEVKVE